jgi:hypothetical protein
MAPKLAPARMDVVAVGLTMGTMISSIIAIGAPAYAGISTSVASAGGSLAGLSVTAMLLAMGAFGAAAWAASKGEQKGWLAAMALTAVVWLFELCAFAANTGWVSYLGGGAGYAFIIITWLLTFPTLFYLFKAYKVQPGQQAPPSMAGQQAPPPPMAQAEMVRTEIPAAQGVATV